MSHPEGQGHHPNQRDQPHLHGLGTTNNERAGLLGGHGCAVFAHTQKVFKEATLCRQTLTLDLCRTEVVRACLAPDTGGSITVVWYHFCSNLRGNGISLSLCPAHWKQRWKVHLLYNAQVWECSELPFHSARCCAKGTCEPELSRAVRRVCGRAGPSPSGEEEIQSHIGRFIYTSWVCKTGRVGKCWVCLRVSKETTVVQRTCEL